MDVTVLTSDDLPSPDQFFAEQKTDSADYNNLFEHYAMSEADWQNEIQDMANRLESMEAENERLKRDLLQVSVLAHTPQVTPYMPYGMEEMLKAYARGDTPTPAEEA